MDWNFLIKNKHSITVTTDSREVTPGCVFVALKGEHFDGNLFIEQARQDGAAYIIGGDHALEQLQDLARAWVRQWRKNAISPRPVIAITGTNGKTTTKELTAAVLRTHYKVLYTQGNYNNSLGVPLTLLSLTDAHEMAVIEMGASHIGDIKELVEIAEPDYGLITNVGKAHLQGFGSLEGVMRTKAELYDYLYSHGGTIFRNADNPLLEKMAEVPQNTTSQTVFYHTGVMPQNTHLVGSYNAENISAALCVGEYFGIDCAKGLQAIRNYVPDNNRSQAIHTDHNRIVMDAYNANPTSMHAAIQAFTGDTFILGAMRELGAESRLEHQNLVNMLLERKADNVFLVGQEYKETTAPYPVFDNVHALHDYLTQHPLQQHSILIKGSRTNTLEKILDIL